MADVKGYALSDTQWRLLKELAEPYTSKLSECWFFPRKNLRTLRALSGHGLARYVDDSQWRVGYAITEEGRKALAWYAKTLQTIRIEGPGSSGRSAP